MEFGRTFIIKVIINNKRIKINIFRDGLILSQGPIDFRGENQQYIRITGFDGGRY